MLRLSTYLAALLSVVPFMRPTKQAATVLLWPFKLLIGALSPVLALVGGIGAVAGLLRRDWRLAWAGALGAGLAARFIAEIPDPEEAFEEVFGPQLPERRRGGRRWSVPERGTGEAAWQRNVVYGQTAETGEPLLADLWEPPPGRPRTGLGVIYIHGGGWRVGDKDLGTRHFFRRLAGEGHVILDVAYSLWPKGDMVTMTAEVKQAILWLKEHGPAYGLNRERIVLMGSSAGGHLALLAGYTADREEFQPPGSNGDTSVRGVVAFYPPTDLVTLRTQAGQKAGFAQGLQAEGMRDELATGLLSRIFMLHDPELAGEDDAARMEIQDLVPAIVGGEVDEIPETYRLLSPAAHVGPHCPPTLLLQGSDDVFQLAPMVRRFYRELREAGVPAILVEFPHTEHAFDLVLPQISPLAQAATHDVERFLALMV
jgi:acetyl esterase/lipase